MKEQPLQNKVEKFDDKALAAFVNDLNQYDKDHSIGAWLGRGAAGAFMQRADENTENAENEISMNEGLEKLHEEIQKNITPDDLNDRHGATLNNLGLNLESPNKQGNIDENEIYAVGSIRINLEDKIKYLSFLKSLDRAGLTDAQKTILKITAEKLIDQVQHEYKLGEADDRLLELFSGMREITSEYERLGLGEKVQDFKDYLEHANSGYLREYILAKNQGLFRPIGEGFALSTYQQDANYEHYWEYWNDKLFATLDEISKNVKAKELYNKVLKYAKDCIAFAAADPVLAKYETDGHNEYVAGTRKAIGEVKEKLSKLSEL